MQGWMGFFFFFGICMPWGHIFSMNSSWVSAALSAIFIPEHSWFRKMSLTRGSQTLVSTVCRCHIWSATACGGWIKSSTLHWELQKTRRTSNGLHMTRLGLNFSLILFILNGFLAISRSPSDLETMKSETTWNGAHICFIVYLVLFRLTRELKDEARLPKTVPTEC